MILPFFAQFCCLLEVSHRRRFGRKVNTCLEKKTNSFFFSWENTYSVSLRWWSSKMIFGVGKSLSDQSKESRRDKKRKNSFQDNQLRAPFHQTSFMTWSRVSGHQTTLSSSTENGTRRCTLLSWEIYCLNVRLKSESLTSDDITRRIRMPVTFSVVDAFCADTARNDSWSMSRWHFIWTRHSFPNI